jgi:glycine cleavage system protein P-like pyridoxal-binding family
VIEPTASTSRQDIDRVSNRLQAIAEEVRTSPDCLTG